MSRDPGIEMHCNGMDTAKLMLSCSTYGCRFSIGRAQCSSTLKAQLPGLKKAIPEAQYIAVPKVPVKFCVPELGRTL